MLLESGSLSLAPGTYEIALDRVPADGARAGLVDGLRAAGIVRIERVIKRELRLPPVVKELIPAGEGLRDYDPHRLYRVVIPPGRDMREILERLQAVPGVVYAEPNGIIRVQSAIRSTTLAGARMGTSPFLLFPNDPVQNWGFYNPANRAADVQAPEAWAIQTGSPSVRIAFLDTGGETGHLDLGAGKVVGGYDFVHDDGNFYPDAGAGQPAHGMYVAGVAAALSNNALGVPGLCGGNGISKGCEVLMAKTIGDLSWYEWPAFGLAWISNYDDAVGAIYWAIENGARVINNSYCADVGFETFPYSVHAAMRDAFAYGAINVASMGNSHDCDQDGDPTVAVPPAAYADVVVSVGATNGVPARVINDDWESSIGPHIDLSAPGIDIATIGLGGSILTVDGTSIAAPFVSGAAGLVLSEIEERSLPLAHYDVPYLLQLTALDIDTAGFDIYTGAGLLKVGNALEALQPPNVIETGTAGPATGCYAVYPASGKTQWVFMASFGLYMVRQCEVRRSITFNQQYVGTPLVWGRPTGLTGGLTRSNPNGQIAWTGVVPGSVTSTGATLRTYVYELWTITAEYLGWYPNPPSAVDFGYAVVGEPAPPPPPLTVTADAPIYVTVKTSYDLLGSASAPSAWWRWDRSDNFGASWSVWDHAQNSSFIAYAGEYNIGWRLFAKRTSDAVTDYGYANTHVCVEMSECDAIPEESMTTVGMVQNAHFGSGAWVGGTTAEGPRVVQLYSLAGAHAAQGTARPNFLGGAARTDLASAGGQASAGVVFSRQGPSVDAETYGIQATRVPAGLSDVFLGLALDPDLGSAAGDDSLGVDRETGLIWVSDPERGAIGYLMRNLPAGANAVVRQFSTRKETWRPDPAADDAAYAELTAKQHALTGKRDDVRFVIAVGPLGTSASERQLELEVLRAPSLAELRAKAGALGAPAPQMALSSADPQPSSGFQAFRLVQAPPAPLGTPGVSRISAALVPALAGTGQGVPPAPGALRQAVRQHGITALAFTVPDGDPAEVRIRIYTPDGRLVRTLLDEAQEPGAYRVQWDRLDARGGRVAPGIYIAVMEAPGFRGTSRLVVVR